jgi:hypothetical protein
MDLAIHTHTPNPRRTIPHRYTNLKTDTHTYNTKHTHTPFSQTTKHGALLARAAADGADLTFHKEHSSRINVQFTHEQEFLCGVHNTRLLSCNLTLRFPMCGQFTSNDHMAGNMATRTIPVFQK